MKEGGVMTKAEEFARLNGFEWMIGEAFTDAKSILEVMITRKDWMEFVGCKLYNRWILFDYILNPDRLLDEAIKFCKEAEK